MRNCLKRDLQDFGIFRIERGRESEFSPTEESGLQTPPKRYNKRDTNPSYKRYNPSYKRYNHKESGLQTPPTEDNHTLPFPEEIRVDVGVSSLYPFLFLLLKQQKPGNLYASKRSPFRCMLFNNFNIYCLKNV